MSLSVATALQAARSAGLERLDAQLLLAHVLGQDRTWLLAHDEAALTAAQQESWHALLMRRSTGEPLAYLLGEKEFHGLMLAVTPDVLVPRPDTETLVEWALDAMRGLVAPRVLDLGTGSGAIALAIKAARPDARLTAVDASAAALAVAAANGQRLGLDVEWLHSDWWSALEGRRFELVVGNPPYIAENDPHLAALQHEPERALTSGTDGLDAIRVIVVQAPAHLQPGGWLLLEQGYDQSGQVQALLRERGFVETGTRHDLAGQPRCSGGCWPGA